MVGRALEERGGHLMVSVTGHLALLPLSLKGKLVLISLHPTSWPAHPAQLSLQKSDCQGWGGERKRGCVASKGEKEKQNKTKLKVWEKKIFKMSDVLPE